MGIRHWLPHPIDQPIPRSQESQVNAKTQLSLLPVWCACLLLGFHIIRTIQDPEILTPLAVPASCQYISSMLLQCSFYFSQQHHYNQENKAIRPSIGKIFNGTSIIDVAPHPNTPTLPRYPVIATSGTLRVCLCTCRSFKPLNCNVLHYLALSHKRNDRLHRDHVSWDPLSGSKNKHIPASSSSSSLAPEMQCYVTRIRPGSIDFCPSIRKHQLSFSFYFTITP